MDRIKITTKLNETIVLSYKTFKTDKDIKKFIHVGKNWGNNTINKINFAQIGFKNNNFVNKLDISY